MIRVLEEKVLAGEFLIRDEAKYISSLEGNDILELFASANRIRNYYKKDSVDLCAIINAKSGACSEDCSYCAQSSRSAADVEIFPLLEKKIILEKAREAHRGGAKRFCIVTSGRKVSVKEVYKIASIIPDIRSLGLLPCATLGLLSTEELLILKDAGLERYHHNLETSEIFFPHICSTHTYGEKLETLMHVKATGLSLCSGGIFGLGENWGDRISLAFALREIDPDSVPINFLIPIRGTKLEGQKPLEPLEALKIISLHRFIMPAKQIRVCGGRIQTLGEFNSYIFLAGADGLLVGNYLTTHGRNYGDDIRLIQHLGLSAK
jgi:biotin synthase